MSGGRDPTRAPRWENTCKEAGAQCDGDRNRYQERIEARELVEFTLERPYTGQAKVSEDQAEQAASKTDQSYLDGMLCENRPSACAERAP